MIILNFFFSLFVFFLIFYICMGVFKLVMLWWRLRQVFRAANFKQEERTGNQEPSHGRQDERAGVHGGNKADASGRKKVIGDDEGEYVEFEEVR